MNSDIINFASEMKSLLGDKNAVFDQYVISKYGKNLYGLEPQCLGIVFPTKEGFVEKIVDCARRNKIPLYPISTGKNWGLGSKLPVKAGYTPQRVSIFQMPYLKKYPNLIDEGQRQTVRTLKKIFDPDNIIARGRYEL